MERVTVHLQAVGIRHFTGPSCYHEAEKWAHDEIRRRDRTCPEGSGVDLPVERDPDMPEGVTEKDWYAYNSPSTQLVMSVLRKRKGEALPTQAIADAAGRSRPTAHRILRVCAAVGEVKRTTRRVGRVTADVWEIAE